LDKHQTGGDPSRLLNHGFKGLAELRIGYLDVLADYVERQDDLGVLRGRLLAEQQILRRFGQLDRLAWPSPDQSP
jgi:hypothetical protein